MDSDLLALAERTVPPIQLDAISNFRTSIFRYKREAKVVTIFSSLKNMFDVCPMLTMTTVLLFH